MLLFSDCARPPAWMALDGTTVQRCWICFLSSLLPVHAQTCKALAQNCGSKPHLLMCRYASLAGPNGLTGKDKAVSKLLRHFAINGLLDVYLVQVDQHECCEARGNALHDYDCLHVNDAATKIGHWKGWRAVSLPLLTSQVIQVTTPFR